MKILLTNDDGIGAAGMEQLVDMVSGFGHEIYIVAPKNNRSGVGQGITLGKTIEIKRNDLHEVHNFVREAWSVDGNPADAVKYALGNNIVTPDLVLSGINSGPNMGGIFFILVLLVPRWKGSFMELLLSLYLYLTGSLQDGNRRYILVELLSRK